MNVVLILSTLNGNPAATICTRGYGVKDLSEVLEKFKGVIESPPFNQYLNPIGVTDALFKVGLSLERGGVGSVTFEGGVIYTFCEHLEISVTRSS